jgi:hypothetical protein
LRRSDDPLGNLAYLLIREALFDRLQSDLEGQA